MNGYCSRVGGLGYSYVLALWLITWLEVIRKSCLLFSHYPMASICNVCEYDCVYTVYIIFVVTIGTRHSCDCDCIITAIVIIIIYL